MYKAKYLQPRPRTGADTVLHLKTWAGLSTTSTLFDYSLNNHPGTLKGTAALKYPGCDLDGDSDYIEITDHDDFTPALTPFSIRAWVYMNSAANFHIASKGVYNTDGEWYFRTLGTEKIYFLLFDESITNSRIGVLYDTALTSYANQWIHLVATYNGGTIATCCNIYLNSINIDDTIVDTGDFVSVENLTHATWIGRYDTTYADGLIDNVMIFSTELSATEVKSDYEVTRSRYGV